MYYSNRLLLQIFQHFMLQRMPTISIRGYKILQYYNVLLLERAPGDELLSKLLSAEKLIITEHPQNSLLHYSCSSAIIYSGDAAGVRMRIFYRMRSQQQPSCAFPQNPTLSVTPGEESLCGMVVCNYRVTLSQISVGMVFFPLFLFFTLAVRCCEFIGTDILKDPDGHSSYTWSGDLDLHP